MSRPKGIRRRLRIAEVMVGVGTAAIAGTAPLALEQAVLTSPRPPTWGWAVFFTVLACCLFAVALLCHQSIRRNGRTLYYLSAMDRAKSDDVVGPVTENVAPRFLKYVQQPWDLPRDPGDWHEATDQLSRQLTFMRAAHDSRPGSDALISNCEWPVAWVLGHRMSSHWQPELWEKPYLERGLRDELAIPLRDLLHALPPPGRNLVQVIETDTQPDEPELPPKDDASAPGPPYRKTPGCGGPTAPESPKTPALVVMLEATRAFEGYEAFLEQELEGRPCRVVRLRTLDDNGAPTCETENPSIPRHQFPAMVATLHHALADLYDGVERAYLLATVPTSWTYALGALMRQLDTLPEVHFIVYRHSVPEAERFALTDLVLERRTEPRK